MEKREIQKTFYKDKDYSKIKETLKSCSKSWSFNMLGKIELYQLHPQTAYEYFSESNNIYGCAYSKFLQGDFNEAKILLSIIRNSSPAADWLFSLINILEDNYNYAPTYFQVRNFYEQDLEMLFLYKQTDLAYKLIKKNDFFLNFNKEIYKYNARVLFNNKYIEEAKQFLRKSLELYYNDPESHFLFGEIYERTNEIEKAKKSYQKANEVSGEYLPAKEKIYHLFN